MSERTTRRVVSVLVIFGAVIFGMVLAGGLDLTVSGDASEQVTATASEASSPAPVGMGMPDFAALAERVSPAVVSIETHSFESGSSRRVDPFEFFFGPRRRDPREDEPEEEEFRQEAGGSGFVVSADGLIVTNNHVVDEADEILVRIGDKTFEAEIKGRDEATDLALLKVDPEGGELAYLALGDSDALRVGEWVMAIGSPQGLVGSVTVGVVSAKGRRINISQATSSFENFIQTDAAINFGNSGGPLINLKGEVIGINTAINYGAENIGFAVPVGTLKEILPQLKEEGRVRRGYIGIGVEDLDRSAAEAFDLESTDGAMVTQVQPGRPADRAGLEIGDIILKADDVVVGNTRDLIDYVSAKGPDAEVELEVLRDGEVIKKTVTLDERPGQEGEAVDEGEREEPGIEWLGMRYQDLTPGTRSMHELPEDLQGVWITWLSPRSPLYDEGIRARNVINVITEVNGIEVADVEEFEEIVRGAESGSRLRIYVRRFLSGEEAQPVFAFPEVP